MYEGRMLAHHTDGRLSAGYFMHDINCCFLAVGGIVPLPGHSGWRSVQPALPHIDLEPESILWLVRMVRFGHPSTGRYLDSAGLLNQGQYVFPCTS